MLTISMHPKKKNVKIFCQYIIFIIFIFIYLDSKQEDQNLCDEQGVESS